MAEKPLARRTFTIKLGTGLQTAGNFRRALQNAGCKIGAYADDVLDKPDVEKSVAAKETEVVLEIWSTAELTGRKGGNSTTAEVLTGAKRLGLEKCMAETGPQLRTQYKDQPVGEGLSIGMEPITDSVGRSHIFHVKRDNDGLWLFAPYSDLEHDPVWRGSDLWVFVRPRK